MDEMERHVSLQDSSTGHKSSAENGDMNVIVLEARLYDYSPPIVAKNPFKHKKEKKSVFRWLDKPSFQETAQTTVGIVHLIRKKSTESSRSSSSTYSLHFINVDIRNDKDLPLYVLLSRSHAPQLTDDKSIRDVEAMAELVPLDNGPEGQWKGCHFAPSFEQELNIFDPLIFGSVVICKPSAAKPPSALPLVFAYGTFQTYIAPPKSTEQLAAEMEVLKNKLLNTVTEMGHDQLRDQSTLSLDDLQRNAKELFRLFDQDKSDSIDFEEYMQMLSYRKVNILESKARRFFQLVDDQKKGYIDEREFVVALYITNYLRTHAAENEKTEDKYAVEPYLSPVDVFYQLDADRDDLLNVFEYEKALELLGVSTKSRSEHDRNRVLAQFPKSSSTISLEQFKLAWSRLVNVHSELKKRNILFTTKTTARLRKANVEDQGAFKDLASRSKFPGSNRKQNEIEEMRQLLLETIRQEEHEEMEIALKAKDEVIRLEKERRDIEQEEKRRLLHQQRQSATSMRTKEALRERQEKISRKKERVIKERQAKEERRLLQQISQETDKRKNHEMQVIRELMATKMDKILTKKAKCGDDIMDLSDRGLSELPSSLYHGRDTLNSLSSLLILNLSKNRLQLLPSALFTHLFMLQVLDASENSLVELPEELGEARDLQVLDLRSNQLEKLPRRLSLLSQLKVLRLSFNKLKTFGDGCEGLQKLEELNLANNTLEGLADSIGALSGLKTLQLRGNVHLRQLPNSLQNLHNLLVWDLAACEQKRFGKEIFGPQLKCLRNLNVSFNSLTILPEGIGNISTLQEFNLKSNVVIALPSALGRLHELIVIDASKNQLEHLPDECGSWQFLELLLLSHNKLVMLPPTIGLLVSLQRLDLAHNRLTSLPLEMGALVNLRALDVSWNQLTNLPEELGCANALQHVNLSHNRLQYLPDTIMLWQQLQQLRCSHNFLTTPLNPAFGDLVTLEYVDLSHNKLTSLEPCLYRLPNIEVLNLASNRIEFLPSDIVNQCSKLKKLDVYNNRLAALPVGMAQLLPRLDVFSCERNPMKQLPEKWSGQWRLQDQYTTTFMKGYTSLEVKDLVSSQSVCYPAVLSVWKRQQEQLCTASGSGDPASIIPQFSCDAFVEQVKLVIGEAQWENRFQRMVRYYFYELKHLGHEIVYQEIPPEQQSMYDAIEAELRDQQQQRVDQAISDNNAFRARIEASYNVDLEELTAISMAKRKRYQQELLTTLRHDAKQLNELVSERVERAHHLDEVKRLRQRTEFAEDMKRLARERLQQKLTQKKVQVEKIESETLCDGRLEEEPT